VSNFLSFISSLGATLKELTPKITVGFAAAAWILLYAHTRGVFPLPPSVVVVAWIAGILCSCLALASVAASLWTATRSLRDACSRFLFLRRDKKRVEAELPFLTPNERDILAYLLAKKQKMFEVLPDGEEAASLISKGFVVYPARRPLAIHRDVCVVVPDHVWKVLVRHSAEFPYQAPNPEIHPWRTHWQLR
jgi:hypothetical protein